MHAKGPWVVLERLKQHKLISVPRIKHALLIVAKLDDRLLIDRIVDQRHNQVVDIALLLQAIYKILVPFSFIQRSHRSNADKSVKFSLKAVFRLKDGERIRVKLKV